MSRVRKSITISNHLAKDIENAPFMSHETDFSNRVEYLCRSAILLQAYGRKEVLEEFQSKEELNYIYTCLRGFIPTSQVNPILEVQSLIYQFTALSSCDQAFDVDLDDIGNRILSLSEVAAYALIGMSQQYWNEQEELLCTLSTENN